MLEKSQIITYWHGLPWKDIRFKSNRYLPKVIFLLFSILLIQTFAELTWKVLTPEESNKASSFKGVSKGGNKSITSPLAQVGNYHLFGDAKKQEVVVQKVISAPETRLRLKLKGVFASSISSEALAIIANAKGKDKTYKLGDKVVGGAILHAVYTDRVILKRNGKLETLSLPKSKISNESFYTEPNSKNNRSSAETVISRSPSGKQRDQLRNMRDTLLKDPAKIWQKIRINPVMKNGEVQGYTLVHNDKKLMQALNLRKTDIITAVNGQSLSDPATLYGLMDTLSDQASLELSIQRDGQPQVIQLSF